MSSVPHGEKMWKSIIIGVLTTVVAYIIVHFIFDKKPKKEDFNKRKEATLNAWKSLQDYKKIMYEQVIGIACNLTDIQNAKKELTREMDDIKNDISNIKKEPNVDNKMLSVIDYRMRELDDFRNTYNWYFDSLTVLQQLKGKISDSLWQRRTDSCIVAFDREKKYVTNRNANKIDTLIKDMSDHYKIEFPPVSDIKTFIPEALIRSWKLEGLIEIKFTGDHKVSMTRDGQQEKGSWKFIENKLVIDWENGERYTWNVHLLNEKVLYFTEEGSPAEYGACPL